MLRLSQVILRIGDKFPYPVTLVDMGVTDTPLIYVNSAFRDVTLYQDDQILGRNCRFLQGPLTDQQAVMRLRLALQNHRPICQDLVNYRSNGEIFYNRLVLVPFREGTSRYFIGLQHEIAKSDFKPFSLIERMELEDKTINPLTILVGLLMNPNPELEDKLAETILRLRKFVLSL